MTTATKTLLSALRASPFIDDDFKIIDATELYEDISVLNGDLVQTRLNRPIDVDKVLPTIKQANPEIFGSISDETFLDMMKVAKDTCNKYMFPNNKNLAVNILEHSPIVVDGKVLSDNIGAAAILARYNSILNSITYSIDINLYESVSSFVNSMMTRLNFMDEACQTYGVDPLKHADAWKKVRWHMPYDKCVVLMSECACVYTYTPGSAYAGLQVVGLSRKMNKAFEAAYCQLTVNGAGDITGLKRMAENEPRFAESIDMLNKNESRINVPGMMAIDQFIDQAIAFINLNYLAKTSDIYDYRGFLSPLMQTRIDLAKTITPSLNELFNIACRGAEITDQHSLMRASLALYQITSMSLIPAFLITMLMSTSKSIRLREESIYVTKPKTQNSKKKRKSSGSATKKMTYSTVRITMEDQVVDFGGKYINETPSACGGKRAKHYRRGNFAFYTEDRPLFGKYSGLVWRPAMIVNKDMAGPVKNTHYSVSAN